MRRLRDAYREDARVRAALAALEDDRELTIGACHGGVIAVLIAALCAGRSAHSAPVIVCNDPATLVDDLEELGVVAAHLPELERFDEDEVLSDRSGHNRRMAALEAYTAGAALVASPVAVEQPVPDIAEVTGSSIIVRPGATFDLHALVDRLVDAGYRVTPVVEGRGELAVRGGIIDVFPWIGQNPLRIEFFGDQVEAIRRFDVFSQESVNRAEEAILASSGGGLATSQLWSQLPAGALVVVGDLPLRGRLKKDHGRRELRFARQLEHGALDAATLTVERFRGDLRRSLTELSRVAAELASHAGAPGVLLLAGWRPRCASAGSPPATATRSSAWWWCTTSS
jgi:hypothetical protein